METDFSIQKHVVSLLFFGLVSLGIFFLAKRKNFFSLPQEEKKKLLFHHLLIFLLGFIFIYYFFTPFLTAVGIRTKVIPTDSGIKQVSYTQIINSSLLFGFMLIYGYGFCKGTFYKIWNSNEKTNKLQDISIGLYSIFIVYPFIFFSWNTIVLINYLLFGIMPLVQPAVEFLKQSKEHLSLLYLALVCIVILAPIIEEFFFRGALQTYLKKFLGRKAAIICTSLLFAFMHVNLFRGIGNLPIIVSLFVFACYLGFLYEKQKSLLAPIVLHMIFNAISCVQIIV